MCGPKEDDRNQWIECGDPNCHWLRTSAAKEECMRRITQRSWLALHPSERSQSLVADDLSLTTRARPADPPPDQRQNSASGSRSRVTTLPTQPIPDQYRNPAIDRSSLLMPPPPRPSTQRTVYHTSVGLYQPTRPNERGRGWLLTQPVTIGRQVTRNVETTEMIELMKEEEAAAQRTADAADTLVSLRGSSKRR